MFNWQTHLVRPNVPNRTKHQRIKWIVTSQDRFLSRHHQANRGKALRGGLTCESREGTRWRLFHHLQADRRVGGRSANPRFIWEKRGMLVPSQPQSKPVNRLGRAYSNGLGRRGVFARSPFSQPTVPGRLVDPALLGYARRVPSIFFHMHEALHVLC